MRTGTDTANQCDREIALAPGSKAGPWIVDGELGRGGMGAVYAVTHDTIGKRAALKVLHSKWADPHNSDRILLEARIVNHVEHPGIVDIFETGMLADERAYIVMERLDGVSLTRRARSGKLPPGLVIDIVMQICDALAAAHAAGIVHRDLKPDNVFLCDTGEPDRPRVKVLDWGVAKIVATEVHRTLEGQVIGTPMYMSPEQARGTAVTSASDIYSLGILMYELFLEQPPFEAASAVEMIALHLHGLPPSPRALWEDIPASLEYLMLAMLAKAPQDRPTLEAVIARLAKVRGQLPVDAQTPAPVVPPPRAPSVRMPLAAQRGDTHPMRQPAPSRWAVAAMFAACALGATVFAIKHTRASDAETLRAPPATRLAPPAPPPIVMPAIVPAPPPPPAAVVQPIHAPPMIAAKRFAGPSRPSKRLDPDGTLDPYR